MPDASTPEPDPQGSTRRALSIEVPNAGQVGGDETPPGAYLRLGTFDPASPTDRFFFEGVDPSGSPPGVMIVSPGKLTQYAASTESVTVAREAISALVTEGGTLIKARRNYTDEVDGSMEREVGYTRSLGCEFALGEKEEYVLTQAVGMKIGNGIDVKATTGLDVALGMQVGVSRSMKVDLGNHGLTVDAGILGRYSTERGHSIDAEEILLRYSTGNRAFEITIKVLAYTLQGITAAIAALMASSAAVFPIGLSLQSRGGDTRAATGAAVSLDNIRDWLEAMRATQGVFSALLVIAQAAGLLLGLAALVGKRVQAAVPNPTQFKLERDGIAMQSGMSFLKLEQLGEVSLSVAPPGAPVATSYVEVKPDEVRLTCNGSSIVISAAGVEISGPELTFGGAKVQVAAPAVQVAPVPAVVAPVPQAVDPLPDLEDVLDDFDQLADALREAAGS